MHGNSGIELIPTGQQLSDSLRLLSESALMQFAVGIAHRISMFGVGPIDAYEQARAERFCGTALARQMSPRCGWTIGLDAVQVC